MSKKAWIKNIESVVTDAVKLGRDVGIPFTDEKVDLILEEIRSRNDKDFEILEFEAACHGVLSFLAQNGLKNPIPENIDAEVLADIFEHQANDIIRFRILRSFGIGGSEIGQSNKFKIAKSKFMGILDGDQTEKKFVDGLFSKSLYPFTFRGHIFEAVMNAKMSDVKDRASFQSVMFPDVATVLPSHRFIRGNVDAFLMLPSSSYYLDEVEGILGEDDARKLFNGKESVEAPKLTIVDYKALNDGSKDKVLSTYGKQVVLYAIKAAGLMPRTMLYDLLAGIAKSSGADVTEEWIAERVGKFYEDFDERNPERALRIANLINMEFVVGFMGPEHMDMTRELFGAISSMDMGSIRDALEVIRRRFMDETVTWGYMISHNEKRDMLMATEYDYRQFEKAVDALVAEKYPDYHKKRGSDVDEDLMRQMSEQEKKLVAIKSQLDQLNDAYKKEKENMLRLLNRAGMDSFSINLDGYKKVESSIVLPKKSVVDLLRAKEKIDKGIKELAQNLDKINDKDLESLVKAISSVSPTMRECVHEKQGNPYVRFTAIPEKGRDQSMSEPEMP